MRFRSWVPVTLVTLAALSCTKNPDTPGTPISGGIRGVARASADSTVIAGVAITTSPPTTTAVTDNRGQYEITGVRPGEYDVSAAKSGYEPAGVSAVVNILRFTEIDFQLTGTNLDNSPPNAPILLYPDSAATNVPTSLTLMWTGSDPDSDPLVYDVYVDTTATALKTGAAKKESGYFPLSGLLGNQRYYWHIVARDDRGGSGTSPVRYFTTRPDTIPVEGLLAYYPFNGNANDASGHGNHCSVVGATASPDRQGTPNSSYSFNGSSYIVAGNNSVGNFSGNTTICFWVNCAAGAGGMVMDKDNYDYYWFSVGTNGLNFTISFDWAYSSTTEMVSRSQLEGRWNFVAVVIENYSYIIYANGNRVTQVNIPQNAVINVQPLTFGRSSYWGTSYFTGMTDDVRIYGRALSASELGALYRENGWTGN